MFETIIDTINTFLYSKLLIVILIGSGIYFTIRTRFPQVRLFRKACNAVMEKPEGKESVSSFQALMVSTASRVGTGNRILDVDHCHSWQCISFGRKHTGTDI